MALKPEFKERARYALRHPVTFLRGADEPPERIRPWEQGVHILRGLTGLRAGFFWQDAWLFQNVFHMPPSVQAVGTSVSAVIDGVTDPIIGAFMDTKNYPIRIQRWFWRVGVVSGPLLRLLPMLYLGLTPWQRVGMMIFARILQDITGTPGAIAEQKVFAHITNNAQQRYRISWAWGLGETIHEMLVPISVGLLGLRDVLGWEPYNFIIMGMLVLYLPMTFIEWGQTCVIQRVPDLVRPKTEFSFMGFCREMKECFLVTRHNKYFWLDNFKALLEAINPNIDERDFFRFSDIEDVVNIPGARGEFLQFIRDNIVSIPVNVLAPFGISIIKKVGGPRNLQVLHMSINAVCNTARASVGVHTFPRVMFHWSMEMVMRTFGRVDQMAERINQFEMFDYVEWKTGRRSEGATAAINGLKRKALTDGINAVSGRLFAQFVLGFDPALGARGDIDEYGNPMPGQGERYMRYMPILYLWLPIINNIFGFLARWFYRHPAELRDQVEVDLNERRRLAEEAKRAMEEEEQEEVGV